MADRNVFFHAVLFLLFGGLTACTALDDAMVAVFGRSMRDQASFDPYENTIPAPEGAVPFAAANWPGGAGEPATGLGLPSEYLPVPVEDMPLPMTQADLLQQNPVVMELENPVPASDQSLARGEELYDRYCAVCHGEQGSGAEAYIADVHPVLSAYDLAGETVRNYPDGYIYGMIRVGRGLMPSYAHAISHYDRWNVVNYVRQLGGGAPEAQDDGDGAGNGGADDSGNDGTGADTTAAGDAAGEE